MPSGAPSSIWDTPEYCPHCLLAPENIARKENAFPHTFVAPTPEALVGGGSVTPLRRPLLCQLQGEMRVPTLACVSRLLPLCAVCCQLLICSSLRERNSGFCKETMIGNKVIPWKKQLDRNGNGSSIGGSIPPHPPKT